MNSIYRGGKKERRTDKSMKGWKKLGEDALFRPIYETHQTQKKKKSVKGEKIGEFSHYLENQNCSIIGFKVEDGPEIHIRKDSITVEGYKKPWVSVRNMRNNLDRYECACWVYQLISEGSFEGHQNED
jgi:hypothetical protein